MDFATAARNSGASNRRRSGIRVNDHFAFNGGLDLTASPQDIVPGSLDGALNVEPGIRGGYRRVDGYERFSGLPSPTDTSFTVIGVDASFNPASGTTITESTSAASGEVAYVDTANLYVVITNVSGKFTGGGTTLTAGADTVVTTSTAIVDSGDTAALSAEYFKQKYTYLQGNIGPVGGSASSGSVLGVAVHATGIYAFRNNAAGTAADMWVAKSTGWTKVELGIKLRFKNGVYSASQLPPDEGTTLTGDTSGATFKVRRVGTLLGLWGTDAEGYIVTDAITGTPTVDETFSDSSGVVLTYVSHADQTLNPDGVYQFRSHNFESSQKPETGFRLYGVDGKNNAFEYDAVDGVFVQIETGMATDTPTHLEVHNEHLFLSFAGGSLQNSGYQKPLSWNVVYGADERSVGEDVTFLREDVSDTLVIGTRRRVWVLQGLTVENFQIKIYAANTGAVANSDEIPGQMVFQEDRGFTTLQASATFGDFSAASLSDKILPIAQGLLKDTPVGAVVTRKKNLYRVLYASGNMLCLAINAQGQFSGWTQVFYLDKASTFSGGFHEDGGRKSERLFFGTTEGYVMEVDKGRSFDGNAVSYFLKLSYYDSNIPDRFKRYRMLVLDVSPEGQTSAQITVDYDYGNRLGGSNIPFDFYGRGGIWDVDLWNHFTWDATRYTQARLKLEGEGYNIGIFVSGTSDNDTPITYHGASLQWSGRVINRNTKDG